MPELKGSKTEKNLMTAFAGESQARNKYTYYASKARKDGYVQIANIFEETANNEKEHAKMWFKLLNGGIGSTAEKPAGRRSGGKLRVGQICTLLSRRKPERKASRRSPDSLRVWQLSRKSMKSGI